MSESIEQQSPVDVPVNEKSANSDQIDIDKVHQPLPNTEDLPMQNGEASDLPVNGGVKRHSPDHSEENSEERNVKRAREDRSLTPDNARANESPAAGATATDPVETPLSQAEPETPSQPQDLPLPNGTSPPIYVPGSFHPPHREPFGPTTPITGQQYRSLLAIIRQIKKAREAGPFTTPVDPVAFNIPHYTNIIKKPMDLSTVETKLNASNPTPPKDKNRPVKKDTSLGTYSNVQEVVEDVRQIWNNTRIFNGPHHAVSLNANKLDDMFETAIQKAKLSEETSARRASISQSSAVRQNGVEEVSESSRPKREIHPPASRDPVWGAEQSLSKKTGQPSEADKIRAVGKIIYDLINRKQYNEITYPFLYPVDPVALNIPDYPKIVKQPMDMSTIQTRINMHHYHSVNEIYDDFKLMLNNCFIYNPPGTPVHEVGRQVEKLWKEKLQSNAVLNARPPVVDNEDEEFANVDVDYEIRTLEKQLSEMQNRLNRLRAYRTKNTEKARAKATAAANHAKSSKATTANAHASSSKSSKPKAAGGGSKPAAGSKPKKQATSNGVVNGKKASGNHHEIVYDDDSDAEEPVHVSLAQKQELADKIAEVDSETLNQALEIISRTTAVGDGNEEIELDIDALPANTVFQLYNLVVLGYPNGKAPKKKGGAAGSKRSAGAAAGGAKRSGGAGSGGGGGGGGGGGARRGSKQNGSEKDRIRALEAQLAVLDQQPGEGGDHDDGSSVAYSEEDSDEE